MIPQGGSLATATVREVQRPSLTWNLDFDKGRVTGKIDGLAAVRQAVFKVLQTDRFWYDIYNFNYGHELGSLIGGNPLYVQSEASRMISEALLQDDRIKSIEGLTVEFGTGEMTIRFTVVTRYGSFQEEVTRGV